MDDPLFRWRRKTNPLDIAKGGKEKDNVQRWIKKVQEASDAAAREVLGDEFATSSYLKTVVPDDDSLWEAQELVDSWLKEKTIADLQLEVEYQDEDWSNLGQPILNSKKFLDDFDTRDVENYRLTEKGSLVKKDHYQSIGNDVLMVDDVDEDVAVESILSGLMEKQYVSDKVLNDLGLSPLETTTKNPVPKMELRHKQVKQRSDNRKMEIAKARKEKMQQREAQRIAKEIVMKEEKERHLKAKKEEEILQREMAKIRKEMEEDKKRSQEEAQRKQNILREAQYAIEEEERASKENAMREEKRKIEMETELRHHILKELEEKAIAEELIDRKTKHKYFSLWHSVILRRRIEMGRAGALADWKCKLRAWNAWKAYVAHIKSSQEAQAIALAMKEKYRKEEMAKHHYSLVLLRKSLISWQLWIVRKKTKRSLREEENVKRQKMNAFLEAAKERRILNQSSEKNSNKEVDDVVAKEKDLRLGKMTQTSTERDRNKTKKSGTTKIAWEPVTGRSDALPAKSIYQQAESQRTEKGITPSRENEHQLSALAQRSKQVLSKYPKVASEKQLVENYIRTLNDNVKGASSNDVKVPHLELYVESKGMSTKRSEDDILESCSGVEQNGKKNMATQDRKHAFKSDRLVTKPIRLAMEERARQRDEKKKEIEERKRLEEEKKLHELQETEEKRLVEERVAKREKIRLKKEEERLKLEEEARKQKELQHTRELTERAQAHYKKKILIRFGIEPWKRLLMISRLNEQIAIKYYCRTLLKYCITEWKADAAESLRIKNEAADNCFKRILMRRGLSAFFKYRKHIERLQIVAINRWGTSTVKKYFAFWQDYVTEERLSMWTKENAANDHNDRRMVKNSFFAWQRFRKEAIDDKEKEKRRNLLRKQVREWLPDYKGKLDVRSSSDGFL